MGRRNSCRGGGSGSGGGASAKRRTRRPSSPDMSTGRSAPAAARPLAILQQPFDSRALAGSLSPPLAVLGSRQGAQKPRG